MLSSGYEETSLLKKWAKAEKWAWFLVFSGSTNTCCSHRKFLTQTVPVQPHTWVWQRSPWQQLTHAGDRKVSNWA